MDWICKKCGTNNSSYRDVCEGCNGHAPHLSVYYETDLVFDQVIFHLFAENCDSVHYLSQDIDEDITGKDKYYLKFKDIKPEGTDGWKRFKKCKFVATNDIAEMTIDPRTGLYDVVINKSPRCFTEYAFSSVFEHCGLSQICIPDVVTRMDSRFSGFSSLRNVIFSDAIIEIGPNAFRGCKKLESVIFTGEESLKYIKDMAFEGCEKLQYINFPLNMEGIGYCAFQGCRSIHFISFRGIREIGVKAFSRCTSLQEIDFNYSAVKTICNRAFEECSKLTRVTLPDSLIELGENVFSGCNSLRLISFPGSLEIIKSVCNGCNSLWRVFLDEGIKRIDNSFNNLPLLEKLDLPNSLEEIEDYTFCCCTSLSEINIPSLVSRISDTSFCGCSSVEKILVSPDNKTYDSREGCNAIIETRTNRLIIGCKNTIIPDTVEIISEHAFAMQSNMHSIFIPASVRIINIGYHGFMGGDNSTLRSISVSNNNTIYDSRDNCNAIIETASNKLIVGCNTTIIPNSVKSIAGHAFQGCTGLEELNLPETIENIEENAFKGCTSLRKIYIPSSLSYVDKSFWTMNGEGHSSLEAITVSKGNQNYDSRNGCNAVIATKSNVLILGCKNTVIPHSVNGIANYAFQNCKEMKNILIPDSIERIGAYAFSGCRSLKVIVIPPRVKILNGNTFEGCDSLKKIIVPRGINLVGSWKLKQDFDEIYRYELDIEYYDYAEWDKWRNFSIE